MTWSGAQWSLPLNVFNTSEEVFSSQKTFRVHRVKTDTVMGWKFYPGKQLSVVNEAEKLSMWQL